MDIFVNASFNPIYELVNIINFINNKLTMISFEETTLITTLHKYKKRSLISLTIRSL